MDKRWLVSGIVLVCVSAGMFTGCTSSGAEQITPSNPLIIDVSPEPDATTETPSTTSEVIATSSIQVVAGAIDSNVNIAPSDLREKPNPKGEGIFVYVPQTQFAGVERFIIWMVVDGQAYPLNAPAKLVTPSLIWPREAPESVWQTTGISPYVATEAIEIVFGQ